MLYNTTQSITIFPCLFIHARLNALPLDIIGHKYKTTAGGHWNVVYIITFKYEVQW